MIKRGWHVLSFTGAALAVFANLPAALPAAAEPPQAPKTPSTIRFHGREIPNSPETILDPKHTAVIVHEMINEFLSPGGSLDRQGRGYDPAQMATFVPRIQALLAVAREKKVRIIYVRYTSHADGSTFSDPIRRSQLSRGEEPPREHIEGEWGWQVIDAVKPRPEDLVGSPGTELEFAL